MQKFVEHRIEFAIELLEEAQKEMYEELKNTRDEKRYNFIYRKIAHIRSIIAQLKFFDYFD